MNVIVCYKVVPEEQDICVNSDQSLSFERAEWKISDYDLNAIEAAMEVTGAVGGKVSALSIGDVSLENNKLRKAVLSRGPEDLYLVIDEQFGDADSYDTAQALKTAIVKIGEVDLVICGEGSSDLYAQQIGAQLGQLLDFPTINAISKITPSENNIVVERSLETETEVLEVPLPAVVSVTSDANTPRIPGMKEILAAGKKPVTVWTAAEVGMVELARSTKTISTLAPKQVERMQNILEGESEEVIDQFIENISKSLI